MDMLEGVVMDMRVSRRRLGSNVDWVDATGEAACEPPRIVAIQRSKKPRRKA
jgi:hypothetical protein